MTNFDAQLEVGKVGESLIARWLIRKDWLVLPVYEVEKYSGKGPQVFCSSGEIIAPDVLAMKRGKRNVIWIEAKHKSVFTWWFNNGASKWETGIDVRHYENYKKLLDLVPWDIWLLFLHRESKPADKDLKRWPNCPAVCPTGLYGGNLRKLIKKVSHGSGRWGASGMVYWAHSDLKKLASIKEFIRFVD